MSTKNAVKPIPDGYHTVTPFFTVKGAEKAIEFYQKAFGAEVVSRAPSSDGRLMHAEIRIGNSVLMLSDEFPEMGGPKAPSGESTVPVGFHIYVADVDALWTRAVTAGATITMPLANAFWGDRYGKLRDPFGFDWSLATHFEDVSDAEIEERSKAYMVPKPE